MKDQLDFLNTEDIIIEGMDKSTELLSILDMMGQTIGLFTLPHPLEVFGGLRMVETIGK